MPLTKKYIILSSIIVVLTTALILLYAFKDKGYALPKFDKIETDIAKIEIEKKDNIISLEKKDDKWIIKGNDYIAGNVVVKDMLDTLENITIRDFVSRGSKEALSQYALDDENKIVVKAYDDKGNLVRDLSIGNASATLGYAYGMEADNKNIYLMASSRNIKNVFNKSVAELRKSMVVSILTFNLDAFTISYDNKDYTLTREDIENETEDDNTKTIWHTSWKDGGYADEDVMEGSLYVFTYIPSEGFSDKTFSENDKYEYKIHYTEKENKSLTIYMLGKDENGLYNIATSEDSTIYIVLPDVYEKIVYAIKTITG